MMPNNTLGILRFLFEPERLPADVVERIADGRNRVWFRILSLWEIAIKQALRRDAFDFARENVNGLKTHVEQKTFAAGTKK
ncbi:MULTISPECIES: PIN domain-containing protein [Acidithiobacillus]|jgi:PIN domain nuclease of toxin-antitoxin system|uniref:Uncharacterized protein n=1 Tax=Acidithiobacillus ferridurans TaxID=1232575 RepID=A0A2Z6ILE1_ACIFI|nr:MULTISPECIES: hypothetical protein [Acidithiobacillus]BBF66601.1 hypothetical protein AFERRID_28190 [Acidithiobacillus ferridurans]